MICEQVRERGRERRPVRARPAAVVVMLSGGRDSTCLLDVAVALLGAGGGERAARQLRPARSRPTPTSATAPRCASSSASSCRCCARARADAAGGGAGRGREAARRASAVAGNLQAWARELRYAEALRMAESSDALIATGHTASDQVETILYRLAASPGRRALLGMAASDGRLIRPLLALTREQTAAYCEARGLQLARGREQRRTSASRARACVTGCCRRCARCTRRPRRTCCGPPRCCARRPSCSTSSSPTSSPGGGAIALARLRELPAALARLVVVRLAEEAAGTYVPQAGERVRGDPRARRAAAGARSCTSAGRPAR